MAGIYQEEVIVTAELDIAVEVREHLNGGDIAWITGVRETRLCAACGLAVQVGNEDAAVVLDIYLDGSSIGFVHRRCAASQVRYMGREGPEPDDDVSVTAVILPHVAGPRAVLLFVSDSKTAMASASGDSLDLLTMSVLSLGWTILPTVGKIPELMTGWKLTLDPRNGRGSIVSDQGMIFLDELPAGLPSAWIEVLVACGELTILSGAIDLDAIAATPRPLSMLNDYARNGILVGARVQLELANVPSDPVADAGRQLAGSLRSVLARVAPAEGAGSDALIPLGATARFAPVRTDIGQPFLFVDLCDDNKARATAVLDGLKDLGFPAGTGPDLRHFLVKAPRGSCCLVWRSQVLIFIKLPDGLKKLWFARLSHADMDWFSDVRKIGAIGLFVGNNFSAHIDPLDLINDLRSGRILGAAIPAMTA